QATAMGWVQTRRDHGGVIFVDLRDRTGLLQVVFNPEQNPAAHVRAGELRSEHVIAVRGEIRKRTPDTVNLNLPTGEVELLVDDVRVLNDARTPPFPIDDEVAVAENVRLKYRYLDLRRPRVQSNFLFRHRLAMTIRNYLDRAGFIEVET